MSILHWVLLHSCLTWLSFKDFIFHEFVRELYFTLLYFRTTILNNHDFFFHDFFYTTFLHDFFHSAALQLTLHEFVFIILQCFFTEVYLTTLILKLVSYDLFYTIYFTLTFHTSCFNWLYLHDFILQYFSLSDFTTGTRLFLHDYFKRLFYATHFYRHILQAFFFLSKSKCHFLNH